MASPTRYERTLANCARSLSDFIALQREEQPDDFWPTFRSWVRANRQAATKHAGAFVGKYMAEKAGNKTLDHSLGLHIASWKTFGVEVAQEVKDEINALTRDKLRPEKLTRLNALGARKSDQFDRLEQNWAKLIEYLGYTSGKQFALDCRAAQPSQPTSIASEMAHLSRKPVAELEQALLRTRAFISLLRCTGMRSITAVTLRLDQFAETEGSALLLKRMERKCGSTRNVEKPIFVCVVPHADPKLCPIVHIAAALNVSLSRNHEEGSEMELDPAYELFAEGFTAQARPGLRQLRHHGPAPVHRHTAVRRRGYRRAGAVCREEAARVPRPVHQRAGQYGSLGGGARGAHRLAEHGAKPTLLEPQAHGAQRAHGAPARWTLGPRRPAAPDVAVPGAGPW